MREIKDAEAELLNSDDSLQDFVSTQTVMCTFTQYKVTQTIHQRTFTQ